MTRGITADELARYRADGWVAADLGLPPPLLAPLRECASRLALRPPRQELLCGVHNPFGYHALEAESWAFLALAESAAVIDAVAAVLGPDLVLWDSELHLDAATLSPDTGRYWPADPLAGTTVYVDLDAGRVLLADICGRPLSRSSFASWAGACHELRYMPATSRFNRDPRFAPNRRAALERPLVNYATRPLWLVRGEDRAGSDFATGFAPPPVRWAEVRAPDPVNVWDSAKGATPCL
jgi:hypothetical protein